MIRGFRTACALAAALLLLPAATRADSAYPSRPITLIAPFTAGGATDLLTRLVADRLRSAWNATVVVENRVGASGNIGANAVAKADPDGYTLLMGAIGTNAVNASLFPSMPYDTAADFAPVTQVATFPMILVVHPSVPVNSVKDLVAYARENPGKLNHGSAGKGASQHLAALLFEHHTAGKFEHVFYRGASAMVTDLLTGRVHVTFGDMASILQYVQAGQLRALAVTTAARSPQMPDLPTIREAGIADYDAAAWYGVFAPAKTPPAVIAKLNAEIVSYLQTPDAAQKIRAMGGQPVGSTPEQFRTFVRHEMDRWAKIVSAAGVKAD